MKALTAAAALLFVTDAAQAHTVIPGVGGFVGGLLHPLLVPAHLLALAALGLLVGQQQKRARRALLALFAAGLLAGLAVVVSAIAVEDADIVILIGAAAAGLLAALARPISIVLTGALAVITGAAMELDSVPDEISMSATVLALTGTLIAAAMALLLVALLAAERRRDWQRIGIRILGSWSAASAILVLALRLAR